MQRKSNVPFLPAQAGYSVALFGLGKVKFRVTHQRQSSVELCFGDVSSYKAQERTGRA